ncbi:hypothetical protein MJ863_13605, partial [Alcaligenes ammonioxydans]|uniref:hypothetical protein n=1 Tax=Alcaligenes ammonioxydans TaxID=2582914 RepID=UPI001F05DD37
TVPDYIVISVMHTLREHRYITLWAEDDKGYRWRLSRAGRYSNDRIMAHLDYYNTGSNIAVPVAIVESLARPGNPRDFDGVTLDMPVSELLAVPNTKDVWKTLLANVITPTKYKPHPEYPGARRRKEAA